MLSISSITTVASFVPPNDACIGANDTTSMSEGQKNFFLCVCVWWWRGGGPEVIKSHLRQSVSLNSVCGKNLKLAPEIPPALNYKFKE